MFETYDMGGARNINARADGICIDKYSKNSRRSAVMKITVPVSNEYLFEIYYDDKKKPETSTYHRCPLPFVAIDQTCPYIGQFLGFDSPTCDADQW